MWNWAQGEQTGEFPMLSQFVFSTYTKESVSLEYFRTIGVKNDTICKSLGFTGRVFANEFANFNIIEGEAERVKEYSTAFTSDQRVKVQITHVDKYIQTRVFSDYQVWSYHSKAREDLPPQIHKLTAFNFDSSVPFNISLALRILLEGYVFENLKVAA